MVDLAYRDRSHARLQYRVQDDRSIPFLDHRICRMHRSMEYLGRPPWT